MGRALPPRTSRLAAALAGIAMLAMVVACGGDDSDGGDSATMTSVAGPTTATDPTSSSAPVESTEATDTFPVTVEHKFGTTTIESEPKRVVTIGWNDQDVVLALGVVPLAYRDWFEEYPTFPWVTPKLGGAKMEPIVGDVDAEFIAAFRPDLIIDVYDTVDESTYETYSQIAPTVVQTADYPDEETPWQEHTLLIGQALGRSAPAEQLVAELEAAFAGAASANPSFATLTLVANFYPDLGTGEQWLLAAGDPRRQLFDRLGFGAQEAREGTSAERLDLLDRDVLVVNGVTRDEWTAALPTAAGLAVLREDRAVFIDDESPVSGALAYGSVLSLPYALEILLPPLEAAADGDPATAVTDL